ncbi:ABC transporter substrate-binding protein [Roseomonas sp. OT10]|uniref:ABC transporter substrate-binding protein n=1 Tax=Roseomonas cutis TaxID=2897332 RepID=UPI001E37FD57|nr:ABC transporter substrate-binding protein [Roseomonas sp. OT10]UFN48112.1 ABC transporter substrate-binding protein [Roseomonas sp. OT10]
METTRRRVLAAAGVTAAGLPASRALAQTVSSQFTESGLVGTLQGPSHAEQVPARFKEAPQLAELVRQGKLPPVEQRVPSEPLVIKPLQATGRYGGTWRRGFIGPSDGENGNRINASDKLLFWDPTGSRIVPSVAKGYEMSADGKTTTLFLRKGMKWSSGQPFTADDFVFWFEDIYSNKDIVPTPIADMSPGGKPGRVVKIDETTVQFQFDVPYYLLLDILAGDTLLGGGQSVRQAQTFSYGAYSPAHYLKQFLPKYSSEAEANRRAKEAGFETWVRMLHVKKDWQLNPDLPTIGPWNTVRPINTPNWVLQRNPYYWAVDTEGNQLPYIDQIAMTLAEDLEVVNLRAMAGEFDAQERHINLLKLPVILENRDRGNYDVHLDLAFNGSDTVLLINHSYTADAEVAKWLKNADFRRALSMAVDREQMNETFWLGLGTPGSVIPNESLPESPGTEWRTKWSTLDLTAANRLLDSIGLTRKDREGFRLRTDNGQRLVIQIQAVNSLLPWPQHAEMIAQHWRKAGIFTEVKEFERNLALQRTMANEHHIHIWQNGGSELIYLFPRHSIPVDPTEPYLGIEYCRWFASNGTQGTKPTDPNILRIYDLFRAAPGQQREERNRTAQEIWKIIVDQQLAIGICGQSPASQGVRLISRKLGNIPERACIAQHCRTPGSSHPETWFFKA